jgi:hypothetical protein
MNATTYARTGTSYVRLSTPPVNFLRLDGTTLCQVFWSYKGRLPPIVAMYTRRQIALASLPWSTKSNSAPAVRRDAPPVMESKKGAAYAQRR